MYILLCTLLREKKTYCLCLLLLLVGFGSSCSFRVLLSTLLIQNVLRKNAHTNATHTMHIHSQLDCNVPMKTVVFDLIDTDGASRLDTNIMKDI